MNKLEEIKIRLENIKEKNINISKIKRKKCRKCKCVKTLYEKEYRKRFDESFLKKYLLNEKFKNFLRKCIGYHYGLIHCALVFYTLFCIVFVNMDPMYLLFVVVRFQRIRRAFGPEAC